MNYICFLNVPRGTLYHNVLTFQEYIISPCIITRYYYRDFYNKAKYTLIKSYMEICLP